MAQKRRKFRVRLTAPLGANIPNVVPKLKAFMGRLEPLGLSTEFGKGSLILRGRPDEKRAWNLGSIATAGKVWTDYLNGQADADGLLELSHAYIKRIAGSVPGATVSQHRRHVVR